MNSQLSPKAFPKVSYKCRELQVGKEQKSLFFQSWSVSKRGSSMVPGVQNAAPSDAWSNIWGRAFAYASSSLCHSHFSKPPTEVNYNFAWVSTAGYGLLALNKSSFLIGILSSIRLHSIPHTALYMFAQGNNLDHVNIRKWSKYTLYKYWG